MKVLVTGAGGFIGHHLVNRLKAEGHWVRGVDIKEPEFEPTCADDFRLLDLRVREECERAFEGPSFDRVYTLAADMGGMGFISTHHSRILRNNALINLNVIDTSWSCGVGRLLFTSSACVYPEYRQLDANVTPLREEDAYPAQPQEAYGWEKLMTERLCTHYREELGLETRIARFHNIFGPLGTWRGGREKAPAALCRKILVAKWDETRTIEIWGDGEQTRSFCYIEDCLRGFTALMESNYADPLNIGQDRMVSINELAAMIARIADVDITIKHVEGPVGVRGRNSDNTRVRGVLGWEPMVSLEVGLEETLRWIEKQLLSDPV